MCYMAINWPEFCNTIFYYIYIQLCQGVCNTGLFLWKPREKAGKPRKSPVKSYSQTCKGWLKKEKSGVSMEKPGTQNFFSMENPI